MSLPLLKRATEDGVTFVLTPAAHRDPALAAPTPPAPRMPLRAPGPGEQYRFHVDMGKCIGCKCCVVACNEQNGNPAAINWRRVGEIEGGWYPRAERSYLSMGCNHCLEPTCLQGCPVDAYKKDAGTGHRPAQRRRLHRLPVLHVELLVRRAAVQPRARRRRQVRHVPQPAGPRPGAGVRVGLSDGRDPDRNRQRRRAGARPRRPARPGAACPRGDQSISTTRITLPANLAPNAKPVDLVQLKPARAALAARRDDGPHAALGRRVRDDLAAAAVGRVHAARRRGADVACRRGARAGGVHAAPRPADLRLSRAQDVAALVAEPGSAAVHGLLGGRLSLRGRRCGSASPAAPGSARSRCCSASAASPPARASTACPRGRRGTRRSRSCSST